METRQYEAVLLVVVNATAKTQTRTESSPETQPPSPLDSETATTATTLATSRVRRSGGDVLNAADLHAGAGQGAEGGLGAGAGGLGAVAFELDVRDRSVRANGVSQTYHQWRGS